jgi:hypothetical protein
MKQCTRQDIRPDQRLRCILHGKIRGKNLRTSCFTWPDQATSRNRQSKRNQSCYVHNPDEDIKSEAVYTSELQELFGQPEEYFEDFIINIDYSLDSTDNPKKIF